MFRRKKGVFEGESRAVEQVDGQRVRDQCQESEEAEGGTEKIDVKVTGRFKWEGKGVAESAGPWDVQSLAVDERILIF